MKVSMDKQYRTRDGRPVRVLAICNGLGSLSPVKFTWEGDKLLGAVQQG